MVELAYASIYTLCATHNHLNYNFKYLQLSNGSLGLLELLQLNNTALVGTELHDSRDCHVLHHTFCTQLLHVPVDGLLVQTVFFIDLHIRRC